MLSKPVQLRHGFGKQLLESLLQDVNFLDDYEPAVAAFVQNILPRIDEEIHVWLLDKYWEELENISPDSSMAVFFRRGKWFCRAMLTEIGVDILTADEWHSRLVWFPKTLMEICSLARLFDGVGRRAQDSLVSTILEDSRTRASALALLEDLSYEGALSERQEERFKIGIAELDSRAVHVSGLRTRTCYENLISAMKSYNWYTQNPAIYMVLSNGPQQVAELAVDKQVNLGRNILQAADGRAKAGLEFLDNLSTEDELWPIDFIRGIAFELFTNEDNILRFKNYPMDSVLQILDRLETTRRNELITEIAESVNGGVIDDWDRRTSERNYNEARELLSNYSWTSPLLRALDDKLSTHES